VLCSQRLILDSDLAAATCAMTAGCSMTPSGARRSALLKFTFRFSAAEHPACYRNLL